jgi:predicted negative regulator of RcsB-dependent stress response
MTGHLAQAESLVNQAGPWNRCFAFRGDVLVHAGDFAGANRVCLEGQRRAAPVPIVFLHRAVWEVDEHQVDAAAADLAAASARAPHFADPLKAWGDLLAQDGKWPDALAKYNEALKCPPHGRNYTKPARPWRSTKADRRKRNKLLLTPACVLSAGSK